jgi:deoxyribodipyrimidine photo-lyase
MSLPCGLVPERLGTGIFPRGAAEPGGFLGPEEAGLGGSGKPEAQRGGETAAGATLDGFLSVRGLNYRKEMSSPLSGWTACSRLSPYLAWGCVSLRTVAQATRERRERLAAERACGLEVDRRWFASLTSFEARLRWHCHFMQKLETEPGIEFENFSPVYNGLREAFTETGEGQRRLQAWMEGRTGYPMVDACMRSVRATGWLNFRMRAMLVSFASYHLWLHWRPTALWLGRHFLDFEPGIHFSQFQMQSGTTGINAVRIFSPAKQLIDQDPQGIFVKRWVPELEGVPTAFLAQPEKMPAGLQQQIGCRIGRDYPAPVVDHLLACREAKARIAGVRRLEEARSEARRVYVTHGSRKRGAGGARAIRSEWRERGLSGKGKKAAPAEPSAQLELELFDSRLRNDGFPGEMGT